MIGQSRLELFVQGTVVGDVFPLPDALEQGDQVLEVRQKRFGDQNRLVDHRRVPRLCGCAVMIQILLAQQRILRLPMCEILDY